MDYRHHTVSYVCSLTQYVIARVCFCLFDVYHFGRFLLNLIGFVLSVSDFRICCPSTRLLRKFCVEFDKILCMDMDKVGCFW